MKVKLWIPLIICPFVVSFFFSFEIVKKKLKRYHFYWQKCKISRVDKNIVTWEPFSCQALYGKEQF